MRDILSTLRRIKKNPERIGHMLGFTELTKLNGDWIRDFVFGKKRVTTILAHRNSYKSSCIAVAISLTVIFYPEKNIIFIRKTDADVKEMITMVRNILQSETMRKLCLALHDKELYFTANNQTEISTSVYKSVSGASQVVGQGLKSSITGKHADIIITDDINNLTDRLSRAERESTKTRYQELANIIKLGGNSRIINTGTRWHQDDVTTLMENQSIYSCYDTGIMTAEEIADKKSKMTRQLFACNYELKIIAGEDVLFTDPKTGEEKELAQGGFSHLDAAYEGKDFTALSIGKNKGGTFYIFGKLYSGHVDKHLDEIMGYHNAFDCKVMYMEKNADKGYLAKEVRKHDIVVSTYHEKQNKHFKISSILKFNWDNVVFVEGTDESYIDQICDYNEQAEHDDAPDSLASLIKRLERRPEEEQEYKSLYNLT